MKAGRSPIETLTRVRHSPAGGSVGDRPSGGARRLITRSTIELRKGKLLNNAPYYHPARNFFTVKTISGAARIRSPSTYARRQNPDWPFEGRGIPVRLRRADRPARTTAPAADATKRSRAGRGL